MSDPVWVSVSLRCPKDGQVVIAREKYSVTLLVVTYRETPMARWESANCVYQYQYLTEWAPLPT
jgi:hypothetical protein